MPHYFFYNQFAKIYFGKLRQLAKHSAREATGCQAELK
jgi:hypothetical protein